MRVAEMTVYDISDSEVEEDIGSAVIPPNERVRILDSMQSLSERQHANMSQHRENPCCACNQELTLAHQAPRGHEHCDDCTFYATGWWKLANIRQAGGNLRTFEFCAAWTPAKETSQLGSVEDAI